MSSYPIGTKIRVAIEGVTGTSYNLAEDGSGYPLADTTTRVRDTEGWTHFAYLGSSGVRAAGTSTRRKGETSARVRIEFDAKVTGEEGNGPANTTQVKELDSGFTHYLFLGSSQITRIGEPEVALEPAGPATEPAAAPKRISPADITIESKNVIARIAELERSGKTRFTITRDRNGQVIENPAEPDSLFPTGEDASAYLDSLDYNRGRFAITAVTRLSDDDQLELNQLRTLDTAGNLQFGESRWITDGVRLRRADVFTADWAKDKAQELLPGASLDDWPYVTIDWGLAAERYLENKCLRIKFGDQSYWGEYTI